VDVAFSVRLLREFLRLQDSIHRHDFSGIRSSKVWKAEE
jgi:hypothetical protein